MSDVNDIPPDGQQVPKIDPKNDDSKNVPPGSNDPKGDDPKGDDHSGKKTVPLASLLETKNQLKQAKQELEKFQEDQRKAKEEKMKADGEIAELLAQKEKELEEKSSLFETLTQRNEALENSFKNSIDEQLKSVKDETTRELIQESLEGKPVETQITLLGKLMGKFGTPQNINHTPNQQGDIPPKTRSEALKKAKESGTKDFTQLIANAPVREKNPPLNK